MASAQQSSFDVVPGDASSSVVLHVPHASTVIPSDVRARILLDDDALAAELRAMTDASTDVVAAHAAAAARIRPWSFVNRLSRLVVDPERFTEPGAEEMDAIGMGAVYTATSVLGPLRDADPAHRADLLARYFTPYAESLADLVSARLDAHGRALVVDVHSYPRDVLPYERHPEAARPAVCLGFDERHTPGWLRDRAAEAFREWETAVDQPFAGTYVPLRHYGKDRRVSSLMVEIRRDQYLDGDGEPVAAEVARLGAALAALVDSLDAVPA
ncbi:N-formylglutamate amidohydrolase [Longivirga aurantiaca]|uniref:N-formylglutamate amidohydrolase n=1 Tax=Longivirga aurantiaca TaxID=1837743 RepID=A0ABW1T2F1_9ACTN